MKNLRVLLVDDEIMIREGFKRLFDWQAHDCEVAGEAGDGMEALRLQITDYILKPVNYEEFGTCIGRDAVSVPAGLPGGNHGRLNLKDIHP